MKTVSRKLLTGGFFALAAAFAGCQDAPETGDYQEYSWLEGAQTRQAKKPVLNGASRKAIPPAVAEKRFQAAVAEAAPDRIANTQVVSIKVNPVFPGQGQPLETVIAEPREIKLLVPEKRFQKASADGTLRVSYDDLDLLKVLNMEPVPLDVMDYLPDWMENLDGKRIRIRGFMMPEFQSEGLRGFILARDNEICCFGRAAKVYDLIGVRMAEGTTTRYLPRTPFDVEGTFHIVPPEPEDDVLLRLYEIRDAKVITGRSR